MFTFKFRLVCTLFTMKTENHCLLDIQTQFLCCLPIKKFAWKDTLKDLSWDAQKNLLNETVDLVILQKYPLDTNYVIRFLRFVINDLESQAIEVHDDLYTTLCAYQSKSNENAEYFYKHYRIRANENDDFQTVILKENRNKISQGTTGLNIWESALAISEWALQNKNIFDSKNVIELGAGTGLSSLIIAKCCSPKSICITDGHVKVIENLLENVHNNFEKSSDDRFHHGTQTVIDAMMLDWMTITEKFIKERLMQVDLIIAADVIYDNLLFESLLTTVRMLFDHCDNCEKFMLANAVRNEDTEHEFLMKLGTFGLQYQVEPTITSKLLYWEPNEFSPIKLYSITKKRQ
ncbi:protein-lysine N-methyltransferase EEF2KMT [Contarinia nasturtii]|uniref:protein-lysine N-methyltransferase EEF2KMT n=1 Tax=Contarinia nasturtii TaxID=265458 RepID=UPI0012D37D3F|nr:protein-lysine N-methyltransferase EEF2KMT [Contarinia nasturtii]